ncbi:hypothetical protein CEY12_21015 [Chryseobacterium sp. T16E-39]|nr:hypothetical protein CEY12_21015 [Chryseobacterium sp. T16E-39]
MHYILNLNKLKCLKTFVAFVVEFTEVLDTFFFISLRKTLELTEDQYSEKFIASHSFAMTAYSKNIVALAGI